MRAIWQTGQVVGLDAMVFIYYMEHRGLRNSVDNLFDEIYKGRLGAVVSTIIFTELYPPLSSKRIDLLDCYRDFFAMFSNKIKIFDVTRPIAEYAAILRGRHKIRTPDAIHLATAIDQGADFFVTHDRQLKKVKEISVITLKDL